MSLALYDGCDFNHPMSFSSSSQENRSSLWLKLIERTFKALASMPLQENENSTTQYIGESSRVWGEFRDAAELMCDSDSEGLPFVLTSRDATAIASCAHDFARDFENPDSVGAGSRP